MSDSEQGEGYGGVPQEEGRERERNYYRATRGVVVGGVGHSGKGSEHRGASRGVLGACVERVAAGGLLERLTD